MKSFPTVLCVSVLLVAAACGGSKPDQTPGATPQGKKVDPATAGSISASVKFEGTPPAADALKLSKDCLPGPGPNPQSEAVLVSADGAMQNVFVHVKDGLDPAYKFDPPTAPIQLAQRGCIYKPRVMGVQLGQVIEILNADPTLHNVHALPMVNQEFNKHQPVQNMTMNHVFTAPEVMVRFKCDVHPWMSSWVGVVAHPYFGVSDQSGKLNIKDLPPGEYTLEAWHEKYGRQTKTVKIGDKQDATVEFTFKADSK
jgi:plastocyanin